MRGFSGLPLPRFTNLDTGCCTRVVFFARLWRHADRHACRIRVLPLRSVRIGVLVARARGGRPRSHPSPASRHTLFSYLPNPARRRSCAPPPPHRKGAVVAISPERPVRDAGPDSALPPHHPVHRTVGISPGEGLGEGTPSPAKRTILALSRGSRAGAGVLVARAGVGRGRGEVASYTALPHLTRRRPCVSLLVSGWEWYRPWEAAPALPQRQHPPYRSFHASSSRYRVSITCTPARLPGVGAPAASCSLG